MYGMEIVFPFFLPSFPCVGSVGGVGMQEVRSPIEDDERVMEAREKCWMEGERRGTPASVSMETSDAVLCCGELLQGKLKQRQVQLETPS